MDNELSNNKRIDFIEQFVEETSSIIKEEEVGLYGTVADTFISSNKLVDDVEFYNWMNSNFSSKRMFESSESMHDYAISHEKYLKDSMLKGKGYEWDYVQKKRLSFRNLFKKYELGTNPTQPGIDLVEKNLIDGSQNTYQMKAYLSNNVPCHLHTPKDAIVVTNAEKAANARKQGFEVVSFKNKEEISADISRRFEKIKNGKASSTYSFQNVAGTIMTAGLIGCAIGVSAETIADYKLWKNNMITDKEYVQNILSSGCDNGIVAGTTSGILVPVSAVLTKMGLSALINIPVAFVFGAAIGKIVDPCFKRGDYKRLLMKAQYFQDLDKMYNDLSLKMMYCAKQSVDFYKIVAYQSNKYNVLQDQSHVLDDKLKSIFDSI